MSFLFANSIKMLYSVFQQLTKGGFVKVSARTPKKSKAGKTEKRKYAWWIEPMDDITNQVIAEDLIGSEIERIEVGEGNERRAWPCDSKLVQKLKAAARTSLISLRYRVYNRCGQGQIRRVPFFEPTR